VFICGLVRPFTQTYKPIHESPEPGQLGKLNLGEYESVATFRIRWRVR